MKTARLTITAVLAATVGITSVALSGSPSVPADRAFELRMEGKSDEAKALLERSLADDREDASAWFELARTEFYHFRFDEAATAIATATELEPGAARYHAFAGLTATYNAVSKAHSAETRDQVDIESGRAIVAYERAVDADPEFHDARLELINMLVKTPSKHGGSRAEAKDHVEMLASMDPVYGVAGECMLMKGNRPKKAVTLWEEVVELHPDRADAHAGLARACLHAGDVDRAVTQIDEALRLDSSHQDLLLVLCRQYVSDGDHARAEQAVKRYLAASPPVPLQSYATFCLAMIEKSQDREERAETLLARAKELDPHCWTTYMEPAERLFDAP